MSSSKIIEKNILSSIERSIHSRRSIHDLHDNCGNIYENMGGKKNSGGSVSKNNIKKSSEKKETSKIVESSTNNLNLTHNTVERVTQKKSPQEYGRESSLSPCRNNEIIDEPQPKLKRLNSEDRQQDSLRKVEIQQPQINDSKCKLCNFYTLMCILVVVISIYLILIPNQLPKELKIQSINKKCSFLNLKKSFPHQHDELWKIITIGIEGILNNNPATPAVYLFLHENNLSTINLIEKIANTSSSCFDPNLKPIKLATKDFISNDYGTIIDKYKKDIKDGGVLIVANLNEIPPENAKALHAICDSISPIVNKVVIFLTLTVNPYDTGKPLEIAENKLTHLWGATINQNELDALITRVTDSVLRLNSE